MLLLSTDICNFRIGLAIGGCLVLILSRVGVLSGSPVDEVVSATVELLLL